MKYFIANWKAYNDFWGAVRWLDTLFGHDFSVMRDKIKLVVCPPHPFIPLVKERLKDDDCFKVGAQDVSFFAGGPYTGEVTIDNLVGLIDHVIVGHYERRRYFAETTPILFQKCAHALKNDVEPIFCIRGVEDVIPPKVRFVAYEPVAAIGTGENESLIKVLSVRERLSLDQDSVFIYGGSVNEENIAYYLASDKIDGVLVGTACLNAQIFFKMIKNAILK